MSRRLQVACCLTALLFSGSLVVGQEPRKESSPFEALKNEYEQASDLWQRKYTGQRGTPSAQLIEPCEYSPSGSRTETTHYKIERWQHDLKVYLLDAATGKTISANTLAGEDPAQCPEKTDANSTINGAPPKAQDFMSWLNRVAAGR